MNSGGPQDDGPEENPPLESLPPQTGLGPVGQGVLAAAVELVSAAYPSAAVVLAGAGAFLPAIGKRLGEIQSERTEELLAGVLAESALTAEDVVTQLIERDDLALLAAEALDAARRSRLAGKAAVLGRSLGSILSDDALIDSESVWIRIVSVVEPPHIRILGLFLDHTATMGSGSKLWGRKDSPRTIDEVGEELGLGEAVLPLVQDLLSAGLLATPGVASVDRGIPDVFGQSIHATTLGAQLFARLTIAGLTLN